MRAALSKLRPYSVDLDLEFARRETTGFLDLGDVQVEYLDYDITFERTERVMSELLAQGGITVAAGGSHSITEATLRAFSKHYGKNVGVVSGSMDIQISFQTTREIATIAVAR